MVRGTRELHQLLAAGKDDAPEADAIRDATDGPWRALSEAERNRVRNLSEDLYSLFETPPPAQPPNPQVLTKLNEAYEAKQRGEWDRALDLLRRWRAHIVPPELVSYLRGSIWLDAGDPATAVLFFEHAVRLDPQNENYHCLFLTALDITEPKRARELAAKILRNTDQFSPVVIFRSAEIVFKSAMANSVMESQQEVRRLEPILKETIVRFEQQDPSNINRSVHVSAISLLGAGYEICGETQTAMDYYSKGLQLEPYNDALLAARGILQYGTSPRALTDLEMAIRADSPLVWPYVLLAHHTLLIERFEECRKLCERALSMNGSPSVMSEVSEWMAIAQAHLGFPAEMVRALFDNAIRLDPSNERAKRNLTAFEAASKSIAVKTWETRSANAVRNSGLAEKWFAMAA